MRKISKDNSLLICKMVFAISVLVGIFTCIELFRLFCAFSETKSQDSKEIVTSFNDNITVSVSEDNFPDFEMNLIAVCNGNKVLEIDVDRYLSEYDYDNITNNFGVLINEYDDQETIVYEFDWGIIYSLNSGKNFFGVPKHVYDAFPLHMKEALSEFNQEAELAFVDGKNAYYKDAKLLLVINNLDISMAAEKKTDFLERNKYIRAHTLSPQQAEEYTVAGMICSLRLDEEAHSQISKDTEIKVEEHMKIVRLLSNYEEMLKETGFSEKEYKETVYDCFIKLAALEYKFGKIYDSENYTPDEFIALRDSFVTSLIEEEQITVK